MTAVGQVPARVAANIARRHAAAVRGRRCTYGCRAQTHLYPCGWRCADHAPGPLNPIPDPTRTAAALRARRQAGDTT